MTYDDLACTLAKVSKVLVDELVVIREVRFRVIHVTMLCPKTTKTVCLKVT